jgi:hypothetical protein
MGLAYNRALAPRYQQPLPVVLPPASLSVIRLDGRCGTEVEITQLHAVDLHGRFRHAFGALDDARHLRAFLSAKSSSRLRQASC